LDTLKTSIADGQQRCISTYMKQLPSGLGTRLRHLVAALDGDVQSLYDEAGLDFRPRFYPFVQLLLRDGTMNVVTLAAEAGVTQPAATQTLNEMKRLGVVETVPGQDRRARAVRLTDEGRTLAQKLKPLWEAVSEAAAELDRELPVPLLATIEAALCALERQPFHARIRGRLDERGKER
jgi:DNA-binding MarR family transcriptional regulator